MSFLQPERKRGTCIVILFLDALFRLSLVDSILWATSTSIGASSGL